MFFWATRTGTSSTASATAEAVANAVAEAAQWRGQLRLVHLYAQLETAEVLSD